MSLDNRPALYVGTYKKYNGGSLFGAWLYPDDYADKDDFIDACLALHEDEEDPELMFQDWENIPGELASECSIDDAVWEYIDACNEFDQEAVDAYIDWMRSWDKSDFEDKYCGHWDCFQDYAEELFYDCYAHECPDFLRGYIDMRSFARDLEYDYYCTGGHVFRNT